MWARKDSKGTGFDGYSAAVARGEAATGSVAFGSPGFSINR